MPLLVYLESLGCKLNQCERDALAEQFALAGYTVVGDPADADLCIVNTCAVTQTADRKSRQLLRHLRRINPRARLVATGCAAELSDAAIDADLMVGNDRKDDLLALIEQRWEGDPCAGAEPGLSGPVHTRTRPLVKIQDGCDNTCTYCIVHVLRGRQRSRPRREILDQVSEWIRRGAHEVVLTGVHVGAYGRDTGDNLAALVRAVLAQCPPDRLRLSSIEPWDLSPEFLAMWEDPRLCRHLHLPLQSGCDATLRRMNRHYSTTEFADLLHRARSQIPDLAVTTDVIVGFPGETDEEFSASAAFVGEMGFARVHVFPYSERPGTPAASMADQVAVDVRRQRASLVRDIGRQDSAAFRQRFVGRELPVLWERRSPAGRWSGLTDNYIRVFAETDMELANTLHLARLIGLEPNGMTGRLAANQSLEGK